MAARPEPVRRDIAQPASEQALPRRSTTPHASSTGADAAGRGALRGVALARILHGRVERSPSNARFSEKLQELGTIQAGGADDLVERALGQVATVHRDYDPVGVIGVPEDVMAPLDSIELPAAALQRADRLARRDRRKPWRHAATVTRSISTGPGMGSPCATSDSM